MKRLILIAALLPLACLGPDGKLRPPTPDEIAAAQRAACIADPRLCLPAPTATPTETPEPVLCGGWPTPCPPGTHCAKIACPVGPCGDLYRCAPDETPAPSATPAPPSPTATPTSSPTVVQPTPGATATPTPIVVVPTPTPPPAPFEGICARYEDRPYVDKDGEQQIDHHAVEVFPKDLPEGPVSMAVQGNRCPAGRERVTQFGAEDIARAGGFLPPGWILCTAIMGCQYDELPTGGGDPRCELTGRRPSWLIGYGLAHGQVQFDRCGSAVVVHDAGRGWTEGLARFYPARDGCAKAKQDDDYVDAAWGWAQFRLQECPAATPAPNAAPSPPGPVPTPPVPAPSGPASGFRLNITNASNFCRGFVDHGGGDCSCEPDGAHRFVGVLKDGRTYGNTVDRDHWVCAVQHCDIPPDKTPEEWIRILQDHRDTFELGGGDEWIVASGIRHEWREPGGSWNVAARQGNPYQAEFHATCGASIEARGCMDEGAYSCPDAFRGEEKGDGSGERYSEFDCRREHRRPVPGAGACGPVKTYEVKK